jgi:Lysozyme like domain
MILSFSTLRTEWISAGGSAKEANLMAAIAKAESGGDNSQHNGKDPFGGSWCAWQINGVHPFAPAALTHDPYYCATAAVYVRHIQGLRAWSTYRYGQYKAFLPDAHHHGVGVNWAHKTGHRLHISGLAVHRTHHAAHVTVGKASAPDVSALGTLNYVATCLIFAMVFFALANAWRHVARLFVRAMREEVALHRRASRRRRLREETALRRRTMPRATRRVAIA